jgi:hypothetical protein
MTPPIFRLDGAAYESNPFVKNFIMCQLIEILMENVNDPAIIQIETQYHKSFQVIPQYESDEKNLF